MSNESNEFFNKIHDHLYPPEKARRHLYRTIARKILTSLGHEDTITRVDHALQKQDDLGIKKLLTEMNQDPDNFTQMIIESAAKSIAYIPSPEASRQLLKTAVSGIPAKEGKKQDTVKEPDTIADFYLATLSGTSTMNDINPHGQSKIASKPNKKEAEALLKTLLKETGFAATEEKFNTVKNALIRSREHSDSVTHFDWTHPDNNQLGISVEEPPETKKHQPPPNWSYRIKIVYKNTQKV